MRTILFLNLFLNSAYADKIEVTLREFASIAATQNNVNILIQEAVEDEKTTFLIGDKNSNIYLPAFKKMLFLKGFDFKEDKKNGFYFIEQIPEPKVEEKKEPEPIKDVFYSIALKNDVFNDVENLLKIYQSSYTYITSTNTVAFFCKPEHLEKIKKEVFALDVYSPMVQFKITVLETNVNDLKDRGSNLSAYIQTVDTSTKDAPTTQSMNYFVNLITMPYSASNNVLSNSKSGFYGVLKYLNQNGYTKIQNSPVITASSNTEASFSNVKNIRYIVNTSTYSMASTSSANSYQYKDVGTKIVLKPMVLGNDIKFDLSLTVEDVISGEDTGSPTTSKKELKSSYTLQKGELLVLSGINTDKNLDSSYGIPVLQDIWFLGNFFKFESKSSTQSVITITIEVL